VPIEGVYEPSTTDWVREQVDAYERSDGVEARLDKMGVPIVVVTMLGHRSGRVRKVGLIRVVHEGEYALVGSVGGAPKDPGWVHNLRAGPDVVVIQDGPERRDFTVREVTGDERQPWWERSIAAYPPYVACQARTDRIIPVFIAKPIR
jgi:deazaflavin-dependent oxidoreductase (nitroreductase family)